MEPNQNIEILAGDMPIISVAISVADGSTFSPSGATAIYTASKAATSTGGDIFFQKSTAGMSPGAAFRQDGSGQWYVDVTLVETDTKTITPGTYYHELLIIETSGQRSHAMTGKLKITATPNP